MKNLNNPHNIILSIAIPTYNRAEILKKSLENYAKQVDKRTDVEIIILDNNSSDHTATIAKEFITKYKNIKYYRNEINIGAKNYVKALSLGNGLYLKLMNDNCLINPGAIELMIKIIKENIVTKTPLFIYQNSRFNSNCKLKISSLDTFVEQASYLITYNNNFGIWRDIFYQLKDKDRYSNVHWAQVDMTLRQVSLNNSILYFYDYFTAVETKNKAYNLFNLFGVEYFKLYTPYLKSNLLLKKTIRIEKFRLFRYFLLPWFIRIVVKRNNDLNFEISNVFRTLLINYKNKPYFYVYIAGAYLLNLKRILFKQNTRK